MIGIEIEFQLINAFTFDLIDEIEALMEKLGSDSNIDTEVIQSCIEIKTSPVHSIDEAKKELYSKLRKVFDAATPLGIRLCSLGVHPFSKRRARITPKERYLEFEKEHPFITRNQMTFATHVHVSMDSLEQTILVMNRLRKFIPLFIALSASSPYWQEEETGFVSIRHYFLQNGLHGGLPPRFEDENQFKKFMKVATSSGSISNFKDLHWDMRPRPDLGTLELRIMDAVPTIGDAMKLCNFAYELMNRLKTDDVIKLQPPTWAEALNYSQACHLGINAPYILNSSGDTIKIWEIAKMLKFEFKPPYFKIREIHQSSRSFKDIIKYGCDVLSDEILSGHTSD